MSKLLNLLAASVGGGIALGVGIRMGESLLWAGSLGERRAEPEFREPLPCESVPVNAGDDPLDRLRGDMKTWVESALDARLREVENRLRVEAEQKQSAMLEAFVDTVQTRVSQRVAKLEEDVTAQGATLSELKEHSLQTERNMHKLLAGIDRLVSNGISVKG